MTSLVQSPIQYLCISCLVLSFSYGLAPMMSSGKLNLVFYFSAVLNNHRTQFYNVLMQIVLKSSDNSSPFFQVLLTILIMWAICGILTLTNVFPSGHPGRTDYKINILVQADWFRVPYPGELKDTHCDFNLQDRQTNKKWYGSTLEITLSFYNIIIYYCIPVEL